TSSDTDVSAVKIWWDYKGTGIFDPVADAPPLGTGVFGNAAAGLARITFDTTTFSADLNDLTTGPLKIDTAARNQNNYFISFDMGAIANPQMTLGVAITSTTFISLD